MKEELKQLKNNVKDLASTTKTFAKKREFFNLKVEEAKEERPVVELFEDELKDSYSRACAFYEWSGELLNAIERVREEHPKYGESSIRNLVKKELLGKKENVSLEQREGFERLLDLYFLYDGCGFLKVKELEDKMNEMSLGIVDNAKGRVDEVKEKVDYAVKNSDVIWEETKLNVGDALTRTRRKIGRFLLDMDREK